MKIFRVRSVTGIEPMKPHFTVPDEDSREGLCQNIRMWMEELRDQVYVCHAWEGEELKGFLVGFCQPNLPFVFVIQAWTDPKSPQVSDQMFLRLILWTQEHGRNEIRAETTRDEDAFLRRWNFRRHSTILTFRCDQDFEARILDAVGGHAGLTGALNGIISTNTRVEPVELPTGNSEPAGADVRELSEPTEPTVQRSDGGGT